MDVFIYGHGFNVNTATSVQPHPAAGQAQLNTVIAAEVNTVGQTFQVPANFTIKFYVKNGTSFDSAMEPYLLKKYFKGRIISDDEYVLKKDPERPIEYNARLKRLEDRTVNNDAILATPESYTNVVCDNYIASRPGEMATVKKPSDVKDLVIAPDGVCTISAASVSDLDFFAVKDKDNNHPYTFLSSMVTALQAKLPANTPVVVNWLVCREFSVIMKSVDSDQSTWDDILKQAKGGWSAIAKDLANVVY
jgi:hypothetical protein